tara:strand:+ start:3950 stop:4339 length:390 start_codon:yes stop_codon:yes gene_type:complete
MADMSNVLELALLNSTLNGAAFTPVNDPYISLWTSNPTDAETGTEVSGGSYARVTSAFPNATTNTVQTSSDITFPAATATWGTVGWIGLHSAPTGTGNMIYHTALDAAKTIDDGDVFKITAGNLSVTLD